MFLNLKTPRRSLWRGINNLGSKNGVTRLAYVSCGAVQITSVSFPLRTMVLPVAGSPGVVLMSGPETEAFLGCVVVSSVGGSTSPVACC